MIKVIDDLLPDPMAYRTAALGKKFGEVTAYGQTFKGIAPADPLPVDEVTTLTFFRKSPKGQVEPNYIHSDSGMGRRTAIYYMNPNPPEDDGTVFWRDPKGAISGAWTDECSASACSRKGWEPWKRCRAKFNRLVLFDSDLYHSRAIQENYGENGSARLIQVSFFR